MRILATTDAVGGVWTYALELARALAARGVHTTLATMGPRPGPAQRRAAATVPGLELVGSDHALEWNDDPWDSVERSMDWLREVTASVRPDLVHLNGYAHGRLDLGVPKVVVAHGCVLTWWRAVHREDAPARYDRYRREVGAGLRGADVVVAPTAAFAREVTALHGRVADLRVVPNGIAPVEARHGRRRPVILAAGGLCDPAKNLEILRQVAPGLPWPVEVAGAGGTVDPGAGITLLGALPREALLLRMGQASVFCHPARYEPFGLAVLEAAASRCALVLADLPALRELWDGAARFVDPDDPEALRATLVALATDPDARDAAAWAAWRRSGRYGADLQARRMLAIYRELVGPDARAVAMAAAGAP